MDITPPTPAVLNVVDCTLREGEQTAGVWFSVEEKLELVDALAASGVRWLDAGMPAVSEDERRFLREATGRTAAQIGASVRALESEVQLALDTGCDEIYVICPVSTLHRQKRLGLDEDGLLRRIEAVVRAVVEGGRICNLVAEDASRAEPDALLRALDTGLQAGADRLFLCDTVGCWTPTSTKAIFERVAAQLPGAAWGVHCHNDYGMATANTVAAIEAGCAWPTATINGVGERAGNASLVEVSAAADQLLGCQTGLDFERFAELSSLVERLTGFVVPQHQPMVGWNAFRHESGIHVDGLLKDTATYESVTPGMLGREHRYVVGKHSGRALLRRFAAEHGWPDDEETVSAVLEVIKSRRPDWARESVQRVRQAIDRYNHTCLGVAEGQLDSLFAELADRERKQGEL
ncbi:MAG: isopropylmalate/homocitrate/citramalate synthase [Myxococcota bacterium]